MFTFNRPLKVKFGDSPHNLQKMRDTTKAESREGWQWVIQKNSGESFWGLLGSKYQYIYHPPQKENVLCKDKHRKRKVRKTRRVRYKSELLPQKIFLAIFLGENTKQDKMLSFDRESKVILLKKGT